MDSYNFTFKDVLKRRERMINRVEKWEIHVLAIIMLVVTAFFTLSTFCFASEGTLLQGYSAYTNIHAVSGSNIIYYYPVVENQTYIVQKTDSFNLSYCGIMFSTSLEDGTATLYLQDFMTTDKYTFVAPESGYLLVSSSSNLDVNMVDFSISSVEMSNSVDGLVDNVGINQIWDIFGSGIDFIYVVIIVALGIFLIAIAIRKISKGKSEF